MVDMTDRDSFELVRDHRRTFIAFERLVLFTAMHVALTLASVALAFIGHERTLAFLLWTGGTIAMIAGFAINASYSTRE